MRFVRLPTNFSTVLQFRVSSANGVPFGYEGDDDDNDGDGGIYDHDDDNDDYDGCDNDDDGDGDGDGVVVNCAGGG